MATEQSGNELQFISGRRYWSVLLDLQLLFKLSLSPSVWF
jgi:hypothetical protein